MNMELIGNMHVLKNVIRSIHAEKKRRVMDRMDDMKAFIEQARQVLNELEKQDKRYRRISQKKNNCLQVPRFCDHKEYLKDIDKDNIKKFYVNCPEGYHVDHIIPLCKGGKHHVSNLQYLTPEQNREKGRSLNWGPNGNGKLNKD